MASAAQWLEGARPRTLFLAVAPVIAGTGVAAQGAGVDIGRAALALVVAFAMQIGVNYANDYSDGIRGTDAERVGPLRLVGSGSASPAAVRAAAFACFAIGCIAGLVLAALTSWWLVAVGASAVAAAWAYTGTSRPYGYRALGEVAVFVFFGLVAVGGTAYVQLERISAVAVCTAVPIGLLACALLVANNLRDIPGDVLAGKRTLAVVLGDGASRQLYTALTVAALAMTVVLAVLAGPWCLLALAAAPLAVAATRPVLSGAHGAELIPTLKQTGLLAVGYALLLAIGFAAS